MLGLAILFSLFIWIIITMLVMKLGAWLGKKTNHSKAGALIGFMLTMGWVFVYEVLDFGYPQIKVAYLCHKEGYVHIYITPEEWRKEIGEEEWKKTFYTSKENGNYKLGEQIIFNGREYEISSQTNHRIFSYSAEMVYGKKYVGGNFLIYDKKLGKVLYDSRTFSIVRTPNLGDPFESFLFWRKYRISNCSLKNEYIDSKDYSSTRPD